MYEANSLAERVDYVHNHIQKLPEIIGVGTFYRLRKGSQPSLAPLLAICDATGISLSWLATGKGPMTPPVSVPLVDADAYFLESNKAMSGKCISVDPWLFPERIDLDVVAIIRPVQNGNAAGDIVFIRQGALFSEKGTYLFGLSGSLFIVQAKGPIGGVRQIRNQDKVIELFTNQHSEVSMWIPESQVGACCLGKVLGSMQRF